MPDQQTVLLYGWKQTGECRIEQSHPVLSRIPYVSRLFKNTAYSREDQVVLLLVTPRIIPPDEEEERIGGDLSQ